MSCKHEGFKYWSMIRGVLSLHATSLRLDFDMQATERWNESQNASAIALLQYRSLDKDSLSGKNTTQARAGFHTEVFLLEGGDCFGIVNRCK